VSQPPPTRRGSAALRRILVLLVIVVLLGGALYYLDGYTERRVEANTAADLQAQLGTPDLPLVDIEGSPFLTQVAARSIGTVRVEADQVGLRTDQTLTVARVDLVLSDVTTDDWFDTMNVSHAEGTARIDYNVLEALAGVPLTYVGDGRVEIVTTTTLLGRDVSARITGQPRLNVSSQTVTLADPEITVAGVALPDSVAQALLRAVLKPIPISGLPLGLTVIGIDSRDDGIYAAVVGDNLPVSR
jgi:hypothetical protein